MRNPVFLFSALIALVSWSTPLHAAGELNSDCHALKLVSASGVPGGAMRSYTFSGTCNVITNRASGPFVEKTVPAEASATWDPAKKELSETFRVLAEFSGQAKFYIGSTTYNRLWNMLKNDHPSGVAPFSNPAKQQSRPLLKGKTTLAEATKLSAANKPVLDNARQQPASGGSPLPWKDLPSSSATAVAFEAEQLLQQGKAQVNGGTLQVQPMQGFGNGWGNNAQLFWSGGAPGAVLDLTVKVPGNGKYRVELLMTHAPDYGDLLLQVEGNTASASFSGFAATVMPSNAIDLGTFQLPAGDRRVSLKLIGKHIKSSGYLVGVDQVRLFPIP